MKILQINTSDTGGGAEAVAWQLFQEYRRAGHTSWLAVGNKSTCDDDIFLIRQDEFRNRWAQVWAGIAQRLEPLTGKIRGADRLKKFCRIGIGQPTRWYHRLMGIEDYDYPGIRNTAAWLPSKPDLVHCHNLHGAWLQDGGYFDLAALPQLSRTVPVVTTLHDAWLLSGHCAHSFGCERWKSGCGICPDLTIYPAVQRDATAHNWRRKQRIFAQSRLYVSTPSSWLMQKVEQSMLAPAIVESRVIPNGVNLDVFRPDDKRRVRTELGLPQNSKVVLFAAHGIRTNLWKDYKTMRDAVEMVGHRMGGEGVVFLALGEEGNAESIGRATIRFLPFVSDARKVARYYQCADVYLHAAHADTFPNTVLEAMACGVPVVATAVGGIPEQVAHGRSGFLIPAGDAEAMGQYVRLLLEEEGRHRVISAQAAQIAKTRFDVNQQVQEYLNWYEQLTMSSKGKGVIAHAC
jgi:glycosyltransferase involved in cell wall biosynthesis